MSTLIDHLLAIDPYTTPSFEKGVMLKDAMKVSLIHHFDSCELFRRFCEKHGFSPHQSGIDLESIPYIPVQVFKKILFSSVDMSSSLQTLQSSATTSGTPSRIIVDAMTAKRQKMALHAIMKSFLGSARLPFLVFDADPSSFIRGQSGLTARSAAVSGFLLLSRKVQYVFEDDITGGVKCDIEKIIEVLRGIEKFAEPYVFFGFTYIVYQDVLKILKEKGVTFPFSNSKLLHIGGWKKLQAQAVSKEEFSQLVYEVFGIPEENVIDVYGFTEQIGMVYPDCKYKVKHAPVFAEVIVRDHRTLQPVGDGDRGLLQFLFPIPHSYPGVSVITDDIGRVVCRDRCQCGRYGTSFLVEGRSQNAEPRGCGDILSEK